jgi:4-alpha-glucanotransferase
LEFGFDAKEGSAYIPHLIEKNSVVYTGTHDNDTVVGWFQKASLEDRQLVLDYANSDGRDIAWDFIRLAWGTVADIAIAPMQDLLSLDSGARMNTPSVASGNWQWRFKWENVTHQVAEKLKRITAIYER